MLDCGVDNITALVAKAPGFCPFSKSTVVNRFKASSVGLSDFASDTSAAGFLLVSAGGWAGREATGVVGGATKGGVATASVGLSVIVGTGVSGSTLVAPASATVLANASVVVGTGVSGSTLVASVSATVVATTSVAIGTGISGSGATIVATTSVVGAGISGSVAGATLLGMAGDASSTLLGMAGAAASTPTGLAGSGKL